MKAGMKINGEKMAASHRAAMISANKHRKWQNGIKINIVKAIMAVVWHLISMAAYGGIVNKHDRSEIWHGDIVAYLATCYQQ